VVKISDARIVAATNADLEKKQAEGSFRNDLYYRLITHCIVIPPLRDRMEDIPLLADSFISQAAESISRKPPSVPEELFDILSTYSFPGNIRELQSMIFDAVSRSVADVLDVRPCREYVEKRAGKAGDGTLRAENTLGRISYTGKFPTLADVEEFLIEEALKKVNGSQTAAAALLGVNQSTLSRRLREKKDK
jgi:transcriptional regulator with PAS, ATPase and Fis domain